MPRFTPVAAALLALAAAPSTLAAAKTPMVGGAAMYPSRTIVENAAQSKAHTTLVAAVQAAGLAETLSGAGPFTVFAPTNAAFARLPAGTVDTLLKPENKPMLQSVLTYHVVPGRVSAAQLIGRIKAGRGMAKLTTVQGETLTARLMGGKVVLTDAKGGRATVTQADVFQSNGVIHVTDAVSLPR
ncbi:MAG TPA: fasciclin domain-containing protein [Allosphingosinicella sp.]|nr:fasciclin domain-containing protein [Allosphingosinicella sp.]